MTDISVSKILYLIQSAGLLNPYFIDLKKIGNSRGARVPAVPALFCSILPYSSANSVSNTLCHIMPFAHKE